MDIKDILLKFKTVAVVGISRDEKKDSHKAPKYLKEHGFRIVPVNPTADEILGERSYPGLLDIPVELARKVDIVEVFRPSGEVGKIVDDAVELRRRHGAPNVIWMQEGITNEEAAEKARGAGLEVVMDHCMKKEHEKLSG